MDASTAKTVGIIAVILLVLMVSWPLKYLLFAPVGVVHGIFNGFHFRHLEGVDSWSWPWIGFLGFVGLAAFLVWVAIIVWVYKDAERRGMSGPLWALIVFFVHLIGLLIYFLVRADHRIASPPQAGAQAPQSPACPKCGKPTDKDHTYCPSCGERLQPICPKCGKEVQSAWKACPHCGQKL